MQTDFGKTADDYANFRAGFPEELFDRLATFGMGRGQQRILDLGCGTGNLSRRFAQNGCLVTGLDPAGAMIEKARMIDRDSGVKSSYIVASAENTGLPDSAFDVVTAGQCWHWFDRKKVIPEIKRLLVHEGKLLIAHFDWLPHQGTVPAATEKLILKYNPTWEFSNLDGIYPQWVAEVARAGFSEIETFTFDTNAAYTHESWRGRIRASSAIGARLTKNEIETFDREHAQMLNRLFPEKHLEILHRCFALICRKSFA